jgi:hypothetical protein
MDMGWFTWWPIRPKPTKHQLAQREHQAVDDRTPARQ